MGPGANAVDASGGNVFTAGAGTQYYLTLSDAEALDASIEALLDTLPATEPPPDPGFADTFDGPALDPARWVTALRGSTVTQSGGELQLGHPGGGWTSASVTSASAVDVTGRGVSVQVKRAANAGLGGPQYGETSVFLLADDTHYAELFIAGGALTAWVDRGAGPVNLTPTWPAYSAAAAQWLRLRESGGTLFFEYAGGSSAPGPWSVLASTSSPLAGRASLLRIAAGANTGAADVARFDNVATG